MRQAGDSGAHEDYIQPGRAAEVAAACLPGVQLARLPRQHPADPAVTLFCIKPPAPHRHSARLVAAAENSAGLHRALLQQLAHVSGAHNYRFKVCKRNTVLPLLGFHRSLWTVKVLEHGAGRRCTSCIPIYCAACPHSGMKMITTNTNTRNTRPQANKLSKHTATTATKATKATIATTKQAKMGKQEQQGEWT